MKITPHYDSEDDVLTVYSDAKPKETIEFADFLNIDIDNYGKIVGVEIFDASEFFKKQNKNLTKEFLSNIKEVKVKSEEWRNNWFITLELIDSEENSFEQRLPPLKKSEYSSPLIASVSS